MATSQHIPWPEWSDTDVNAERWGSTKVTATVEKPKSAKGKKGSVKSGATTVTAKSTQPVTAEIEHYQDPYPIPLPWSIRHTCSWIRPGILYPNARHVIFSPGENSCPDLVSENRWPLRSAFMRAVVAAVHTLVYLGKKQPFFIEWQTSQFQSNTNGEPWQPWHHVYSLCRAGKGQTHMPLVNTMGKYIVRLYWLGCWRKILVDDRYPVDSAGHVLLPVSTIHNDKDFELWPGLLTKALLKIASLSWTDVDEIVDFDVISCLTGWSVQKINTIGMDITDVWEVCCSYSNHFTWNNSLLETKKVGPDAKKEKDKNDSKRSTAATKSERKKDKSSSKKEKSSKGSKKDKSSKSSKSTKTQNEKLAIAKPRNFYLMVSCSDLSNLEENYIEDITPCWQHDFLIEETRNIPLIAKVPDYDRNIAAWKKYRWIDWAVANGLWDRVEEWEIFKCIRLLSSLRKVDANMVYDLETTEKEKFINHSAYIIDEFVERKKREETDVKNKITSKKKEVKEAIQKTNVPIKEKNTETEKKSNPGLSPKGKKLDSKRESAKEKKRIPFKDPCIWSNFTPIAPYINCISVYFKPSSFKINYIVSDINFNEALDVKSKKVNKKEDHKKKSEANINDDNLIERIYWENVLTKSRNEPLYLFTDSIDFKLILFDITHLGNVIPKPSFARRESFRLKSQIECKKIVCKLNKCEEYCFCQNPPSSNRLISKQDLFVETRKSAHLIIEEFNWKELQVGNMPIFLKTYGSKSLLLDFEKGRHVKKLWFHGNSPYVLKIFCDTDIKIGKIDEILDCMVGESEILTQCCYNVCSSFGNLIRCFGTADYAASLKEFYKSYMPTFKLNKVKKNQIHDCFIEELINLLANSNPVEKHYQISRALRVLFLNPNFRIPHIVYYTAYEIENNETECPCEDVDGIKLRENSAVKIQAFFKMIYIQKLKSLHNPYHKNFEPILDTLKHLYNNTFSSKTRTSCIDLLRSIVVNKTIEDSLRYFPFYKDLNSVITIKSSFGDISDIQPYTWVFIVRRIFYCYCSDAIFIRAYLFCSLSDYVLRIFNNDTGEEIERYTNNALVAKYERNKSGYTILGYGKSGSSSIKVLNWKMYLVIDKIINTCPVTMDNVKSFTTSLKGQYVPNLENLICKFSVKITESCIGTFCFKVSSDTAKIMLKCSNMDGDVLYESVGISSVIIPAINLIKKQNDLDYDGFSSSKRSIALKIFSENSNNFSTDQLHASKTKEKRPLLRKRSLRKSLDSRSNSRISTLFTKKKRKSAVNLTASSDTEIFTDYLLQAYVLENSWPLTVKEWELVETLRTKMYIERELKLDADDELTKITVDDISSKLNTSPSRKILTSLNNEMTPNQRPFWTLICVNDTENYTAVQIDDRRAYEIKLIKKMLFENDTARFLEGKKLREEFLKSHYIKWTPEKSLENIVVKDFSSQHNTLSEFSKSVSLRNSSKALLKSNSQLSQEKQHDSAIGLNICPECSKVMIDPQDFVFLKAPESIHKMLPPFDINRYDKNIDKFRWFVTPEDEEKIIDNIHNNITNFQQEHNEYLSQMNKFLEEGSNGQKRLWSWFADIRKDSQEMMKENEIKREELIKKMQTKHEEAAVKNKKGKKKK